MRKKILFIFGILSLVLYSCSVSPDDMLKDFNDSLYKDVGGGLYENKNGVNVFTRLIPRDVYTILEHSEFSLVISDEYIEYEWKLKDNKTSKEYKIPNAYYRLRIGSSLMDFSADREYTLTVLVKDTNGKAITDSAIIKVKK